MRGPQQAATVTLAVGSVHGPKCPLPLVASVEVALPVRWPPASALTHHPIFPAIVSAAGPAHGKTRRYDSHTH